MNIEINTTTRTITLLESTKVQDLLEFMRQGNFSLEEYSIASKPYQSFFTPTWPAEPYINTPWTMTTSTDCE